MLHPDQEYSHQHSLQQTAYCEYQMNLHKLTTVVAHTTMCWICHISYEQRIHNNVPLTYLGLPFIHVYVCSVLTLTFLAHVSSVTGQAKAEEWINLVNASASIFTWLWLAVIYVCEGGKKKNSKSRLVEGLIRVQIKRMYSAEEMLFITGEKLWPSAAIQTLTRTELVIRPGLDREICPCWWVQCHNSSGVWGEYTQSNHLHIPYLSSFSHTLRRTLKSLSGIIALDFMYL